MKLNEIITDRFKVEQKLKILIKHIKPEQYEIHEDGSVSFVGDLVLVFNTFKKLTVRFRKVTGDFSLTSCANLVSLEGCPEEVTGDFVIYQNTQLTSLKHMPKKVGGDLKGFGNSKMTSLEGLGDIGGEIILSACTTLRSISEIKKATRLDISGCPLITNMLYLFKIKGLIHVTVWNKNISQTDHERKMKRLQEILNKHLAGDRDIMECQEELIEAGLEEYAKL
jgi:hypothetical protein